MSPGTERPVPRGQPVCVVPGSLDASRSPSCCEPWLLMFPTENVCHHPLPGHRETPSSRWPPALTLSTREGGQVSTKVAGHVLTRPPCRSGVHREARPGSRQEQSSAAAVGPGDVGQAAASLTSVLTPFHPLPSCRVSGLIATCTPKRVRNGHGPRKPHPSSGGQSEPRESRK